MKSAIRKYARKHFVGNENAMLADLDVLQLSPSPGIFDVASKLFVAAHVGRNRENEEFMKYFQAEWLKKSRNWYEGVAFLVPSTNNAVESFNNKIKTEATLRKQLQIGEFVKVLVQSLERWSLDCKFEEYPAIGHELWGTSVVWAKGDVEFVADGDDVVMCPCSGMKLADDPFVWNKLDQMEVFEDYKRALKVVRISKGFDDWMKWTCTCAGFFKNHVCVHVVGLAIRLRLIVVPSRYVHVKIVAKPKRGRPKGVSKALVKD